MITLGFRTQCTDAGRDALAAALPGVRDFHAPASNGLDAQQLAVLDDLLHVILERSYRG